MTTPLPPYLQAFAVDASEQSAFLKRHHMHYKKLQNGMQILAISGRDPNSAEVEVDIDFATGSYFDEPHPLGTHHFLEHLINKPLRQQAESLDVGLNASTSYYSLSEHISGPLAPHVPNYGVSALSDQILKRLHDPTDGYDDLAAVVDSERQVIKNEVDRNQADHSWQTRRNLLEDVLSEDNPMRTQTAGTHATLDQITPEVLKRLSAAICTPQAVTVHIYNNGASERLEPYLEQFEKAANEWSKTGLARRLEWKLLDQVAVRQHPRFALHDTGLRNEYASICLVWNHACLPYSPQSLSLNMYMSYLHEKVHEYARRSGIGYVAYARSYALFEQKLIVIQFDTSKKSKKQLEALAHDVQKALVDELLNVDAQTFETIVAKARANHLANPIHAQDTLAVAAWGLDYYDRLFDIEKTRVQTLAVTPLHLNYWVEFLRTNPPSVVSITADLS